MKLKGINAVITGANQGFGLEMARTFLQEGANIFICARDGKKLEAAANSLRKIGGGEVKTVIADMSREEDVAHLASEAIKAFGRIHVLVNNAGVYGPKGPSEQVDSAEWVHAVQINLFGVFFACKHFVPHMKARGGGRIINMSGGGATAPLPRISSYAASKAAVVRFTETIAEELKGDKIYVNAIAPGALNTRLLDEVLEAGPEKVGEDFYKKALKQRDNGGAPLNKGAELAVFLASPESDGITGRLVSAIWDPWNDFGKHREELASSDIYTLRRIVPEDRGKKWN